MAMATGQNAGYMRGGAGMPYGAMYNLMPHGASQMSNMAYYQNMAMVFFFLFFF